jgi:hypothetical protein
MMMKKTISAKLKMAKMVTFLLVLFATPVFGQQKIDSSRLSAEQKKQFNEWLQDLYKPGVEVIGDSVSVSKETAFLMENEAYRNVVFPKIYTWDVAKRFLEKQDLKKAFWYFINLYSTDNQSKEIVIRAVIAYNEVFKMDEVLKSVFYTYSLVDPEIGSMANGHSEVTDPHILEKKLQVLKELLLYIDKSNAEKTRTQP